MIAHEMLVSQMLFLVTASDHEVDPDVGLAQLEALIADARRCAPVEKTEFAAAFEALRASIEARHVGDLDELRRAVLD